MNDVLNKIKFIDCVIGEQYRRSSDYVNMYFQREEAKRILNKIFGYSKIKLDLGHLTFLSVQKEMLLSPIEDFILKNRTAMNEYLEFKDKEDMVVVEDESELEVLERILNSEYSNYAKTILEHIRCLDNVKTVDKVFNTVEEYKWSPNYSYSDDTVDVGIKNLLRLMSNSNVLQFNEGEINNIVKGLNTFFSLDVSLLSKEELRLLSNPLIKYCYSLDIDELNIISRLHDFIEESSLRVVKRDAYIIFRYYEDVNSLIDVMENKLDKDGIKKLIEAFLLACKENIIQTSSDINLLRNKILYGYVINDVYDIAYILTGISRDINLQKISFRGLKNIMIIKRDIGKGFYRKLSNSLELMHLLSRSNNSALIEISNCLEMGQLNEKQIADIIQFAEKRPTWSHDVFCKMFDVNVKFSYDEFMLMCNNRNKIDAEFLKSIEGLKCSQRYLKIKERIKIVDAIKDIKYQIDEDIIFNNLEKADIIREFRNNNPLKLTSLSDYIEYFVLKSEINGVDIQVKDVFNKVRFLLNIYELEKIKSFTLSDLNQAILNSCKVRNILDELCLSEEFMTKYQDSILDFCVSEKLELVEGYLNNMRIGNSQRKSIGLIAKSIIANKYEELKFVRDDISKEIGMDISDDAFDIWKRTDCVQKEKYTVRDVSDFETIMKIGVTPVETCMRYTGGSYSKCLLSNFDTAKKILTIHKDGVYVGRAILRITMMSDFEDYINTADLSFKDFDDYSNRDTLKNDSSKMVIFLEKLYTTLDKEDIRDVYPLMVSFLKEKAESMRITLVVSNYYSEYNKDENASYEDKYILITASKNGYQYLDSFDGSTSNSLCFKKGRVLVCE